jgi:hypothetical protein
MRGVGHSNGQVHAAPLASKVGLLQEQQQLNARHSHHGMQITSARWVVVVVEGGGLLVGPVVPTFGTDIARLLYVL